MESLSNDSEQGIERISSPIPSNPVVDRLLMDQDPAGWQHFYPEKQPPHRSAEGKISFPVSAMGQFPGLGNCTLKENTCSGKNLAMGFVGQCDPPKLADHF